MNGTDTRRWSVLADLAQRFDLRKIAEVGVKSGKLTGELLKLLPDAHIIAVDPWLPCSYYYEWDASSHKRHENKFNEIVKAFPGRVTKMKMTSQSASKKIPDGSLDLVFIDGDHSYEAVRLDIDCWLPKVRPGGVISGHDFDNTVKYGDRFRGVDKAVKETFAGFNTEPDHVWWVRV